MKTLPTLLIATTVAAAGCASQPPPTGYEKTPPPPPQYQTREQASHPTIFRLENEMTPEEAAEAGLVPQPEEAEEEKRDE